MFENTKKSTNKYVSYSIHNLYTLLLVSIQQNSQKLQTKFSNLPNKILKSTKQNSQIYQTKFSKVTNKILKSIVFLFTSTVDS